MSSYHFRPYVPEDLNFIMNSWGTSYYKGSDYHHWMSPETFHHYHRPIRLSILNKPTIAVIVCASTEDPTLIIGWIVVEKPFEARGIILHYIYVKQAFKEQKISNELYSRAVLESPVFMTHMTDKARRILNRKELKNHFLVPHLI